MPITITGANNAAVITGDASGTVVEAGGVANGTPGTPTATGDLNSTDVDNPNDAWTAVGSPMVSANGFGSYTLTAAGVWTYTLDNSNPAVQALNVGQTLTDTFTATTVDGTQQLVTITIDGTNDAAVISGVASGSVIEAGGVNNGTPGTPTATGDLNSTDIDNPNDAWTAVGTATASTKGYGTYTLTDAGLWSYTLDNSNADVQARNVGQILTDTFTVFAVDGTSQVVTITIAGTNDAPVVTGAVDNGTVTEGPLPVMIAVGSIRFGDVDLTDAHVIAVTPNGSGYLGNFAAIVTDESTGDGVGQVTWLFAANNALRQSLGVDQVLVQTYTVEIADGHGGTATQSVTITINGTNDAAVITGETTGTVVEAGGVNNGTPGTPTDTGDLNSIDVDDPADSWEVISFPTASTNGYGTFTIDAAGVWAYTLDNNNTAVQALNVGQTLTDTFTVATVDGTEQDVSITITGANDAAVVTGPVTGTVVEAGGVANGTPGIPTVTRDLLSTDVDNPPSWAPVGTPTTGDNGYGTYTLTAAGVWSYTLDNSNPAVQALNVGQTLTDTFTASTVDGTAQLVTVTIAGRNDAAVITGETTGTVTEASGVNNGTSGIPTATGNLNSTDIDNSNDLWDPVNTPLRSQFGTYTLTAEGAWTYTLDNDNPAVQARNVGQTLTDTFAAFTVDGTEQLVTITIDGRNDTAVISGVANGSVTEAGGVANGTPGTPTATGDLNSTDLDNPNDVWTAVGTATASAKGFGTYTLSAAGLWSYTLDNSNADVQALNVGQTLTDTFTATTVDGTAQLVTITIHGTNDIAVISGVTNGAVVEASGVNNGTSGIPTATGNLNSTDIDNSNDLWDPVNTPLRSQFGTYTLTAEGAWTYTLDNDNPAVQARNVGQTLTDTFAAFTVDGTEQLVTITIDGRNDTAVISGVANGSVTEAGGVANGTPGTPTATGDLNSTDLDNPNDVWTAVSTATASASGFGSYTLSAAGVWSYTLDNSNADVQALNVGQTLTDTFTATTVDGTAQLVTITIHGTNDIAVISGVTNGAVVEASGVNNGTSGIPTATGNLNSTDIDNSNDLWDPVNTPLRSQFGTYTLTAEGAWTYTLDNDNPAVQARNVGQTLTDTFAAFTVDGTEQLVTITIDGRNDTAVISGVANGSVTEAGGVANGTPGTPTATGDLNSTDLDNPNDAWTAVGTATASANGFGSYTLSAAGVWSYTLDNSNADVQALNVGQTLTDTFTATTVDGTAQLVTITIDGTNDAAVISGVTNGAVVEAGGVNNGTPGTPTATGDLNSTDIDNPSDAWTAVDTATASTKGYGTYTLTDAGLWSYTLDNSNADVQARNVGQILTDTFTVFAVDGTSQVVTIIITGANDAAVISGDTNGAVVEAGGVANGTPGTPVATGDLNSTDVDDPNDAWTAVNSPTVSGFGSYTLTAAGLWIYTLDNSNADVQALNVGQTLTDTFTATTVDGTEQLVTITINGANDTAVIGGDTTGTVVEAGGVANGTPGIPIATGDVDNPSDTWQPVAAGAATANGYGTFALDGAGVWSYTLDNSNAAVQALNVGQTLTDTFTATTVDGTEQLVTITIDGRNDAAVITGETTGTVTEAGGVNNGTSGIPTATGNLNSTDIDNSNDLWDPVNTPLRSQFGTYTLTAEGAWTYTLDNDNPAVQARNVGQTLTDTFAAFTVDGTEQLVTITIDGRNDTAVISGVANGSVTEAGGVANGTPGTPTATGDLNSTDLDNPNDVWTAVSTATASASGFGSYTLSAAGVWSYTLDNSNADVQALNVGQTLTDTFTATTVDGTAQLVTITIDGTNDAAVISGVTNGAVVEAGGVANGTPGTPTATGDLNSTDIDNPSDAWTAVDTATASTKGYGTYTLTDAGLWSYTLDNSNADVQARNVGQILTDTFTVFAVDGTSQVVTIIITGANDAAVISGDTNGAVVEAGGVANGTPGTPVATGDLNSTDVDDPNDAWTAVNSPTVSGFGSYTLSAAGVWSYTLDNSNADVQALNVGQTLTDTFTATTVDGTEQLVTITIDGTNDAAVISGDTNGAVVEAGGVANGTPGTPTATGDLNSTDIDNPSDAWTAVDTATASTKGYGTYTLTDAGLWSYTLDNSNADVQARNVGQILTDTFTVFAVNGTSQVVTIIITGANDAAVISGDTNGAVVEAGGVANGTPGTPVATGDLNSTDLDDPNDAWTDVNSPTVSGFGSYTLSAAGVWSYTLDNSNADVQALNVGQTLTDTFTATTVDGTEQLVTITINGANDTAVISGDTTGTVVEAGGVANGTPGTPTATGDLNSTDIDNPSDAWTAVDTATASTKGYGSYTLTAAGLWTYTLDNSNADVQARNVGQILTDTFTVFAVDGTSQVVTIIITGANDTAVISGDTNGAVVEAGGVANGTPGTPVATGDLNSTDVDDPNDAWTAVNSPTVSGFGSYTLSAAGVWSYTLDNSNADVQALNVGQTLTDTFTATTVDGTEQLVTITIDGANDASNNPPEILGGDSEKYSISENTTFVFDVTATDPDGGTLTYSIVNTAGTDFDKFTIDPNTGVLAFISAPSFESPNDVGGQDNDNKYVVDIQVSDGVLTDTQTIEVQVTNVTVNAIDDIVRTGSPITVVPEWAFLHNDTSSVGNILDITATGSVSDLSDASLGIIPGSVTINNNDADGGSFVYTASDGIETDTATATVETGATPMTGDNDDEILVGTSAAETINGGGGNDILIGGGGADTLIGGNGDDVLVYAPGVSFITGGSNLNANVLAANNRGDILSVSGTVDFTSLPDVFDNIETISMLAKDGSAGNSTITLDVTDVLNIAVSAFAQPGGLNFNSEHAIRIDGTSGDVVNLGPDPGTWLLATGATGIPDGYTAYSHVTSGLVASANEDAYLLIQTGITVHGVGT